MKRKQLLSLLLAVSIIAASAVMAEGTESGSSPNPADLPTAGAWTESGGTEYDTEFVEIELYAVPEANAAETADTPEEPETIPNSAAAPDEPEEPEANAAKTAAAPGVVVTSGDTPEASDVAGPDDGGIRPERKLDKDEQRDARKREQIVRSATEMTEPLAEISFAEVEKHTREENMTVRTLRTSIDALEGMDYEESEESLLKVLNGLSTRREMIGIMFGNEPLAQTLAATSLESQYESLDSTFENLYNGTTRRSNRDAIEQMNNAMNQIVMNVETLYIAIVAQEAQYFSLTQQLNAFNLALQELEPRYQAGKVSASTLSQTKASRRALISKLETRKMNIRAYKMRLENLLGASMTGEIKLGELPAVTEAQIAALDVERDFAAAYEKSYELYAAARTLQDAKETFQSGGEKYHYNKNNSSYKIALSTWLGAQNTYNMTVRGYELKFRTLYEQTLDYYQVWEAAKDALTAQGEQYQEKESQYKQGSISYSALLTAKDELREKGMDVQTAANNLFSSYNNYCWAVRTGILN